VTLDRVATQRAVACPNWQEFRKSLKRMSTQEKLRRLHEYVKIKDWRARRSTNSRFLPAALVQNAPQLCCDYEKRCVQALNYLTSLSRGGQIAIIPRKWQWTTEVEEFLRDKHYEVLK
jgi:hypothetical protein